MVKHNVALDVPDVYFRCTACVLDMYLHVPTHREFFPYLRQLLPKALNTEDSIRQLNGPASREDGYGASGSLY
jgi:hypothetical protein